MHEFDVEEALRNNKNFFTELYPGVLLLNEFNLAGAWLLQQNLHPKLPVEIWGVIIENIVSTNDQHYVAVFQTISDVHDSLCFRKIYLPSDFENQDGVIEYESFLGDIGGSDSYDYVIEVPDTKHKTYSVSSSLANSWNRIISPLRSENIRVCHPTRLAILCGDVDVPDVISHIFDGECGICDPRTRSILCPDCTCGTGQPFDAFMGCEVDLACPLCLGYAFCQEDDAVLQEYYYTSKQVPDDVAMARRDRWNTRLKELGYAEQKVT